MTKSRVAPILDPSSVFVRLAAEHAIAEFVGVPLSGFLAEDSQALFLLVVIFCSEGVVL